MGYSKASPIPRILGDLSAGPKRNTCTKNVCILL